VAKFEHLEELFNLELGQPIKIAFKLSDKVLHSTSIERTNVQLANSVFHDSTIQGLNFYADQPSGKQEWKDTALFLQTVRNWWNIVNVKTAQHGWKKRNSFLKPISLNNRDNLNYLQKFHGWLQSWKDLVKNDSKKGLSKETFLAMEQTNLALKELAEYLLNEGGFSFVMLGYCQSDPIERRFGWYRHLAGSVYFLSVRQVLEAEKCIRLRSLLKFSGLTLDEVHDNFEDITFAKEDQVEEESQALVNLFQDQDCKVETTEDSSIVFYVAGRFARSIIMATKCQQCQEMLKKNATLPEMTFEDNCET